MSSNPISSINLVAFFLLLTIHTTTPSTAPLSFNLSSIRFSDGHRLNITGDAYITDQGIQVTPDNRAGASGGRAGRATYIEPLRLWDKASGSLTDFSTHFSFLMDSNGSSQPHGDGVAFFMAPIGSSIKPWSYGGSLGLGKATNPMNPSSLEVFVAVEFDTFYNPDYGPSVVPHVGVDINRMISVATAKWDADVRGGAMNDASISYNASSKMLSVEFSNAKTTQRGSLVVEVDLREYLPEYVTVGFSASTGDFFETHNVVSWDFSSSLQFNVSGGGGKKKKTKTKMMLGLIVGLSVGLPIVVLSIALWIIKRRAALQGNPPLPPPPPPPPPPPLSVDEKFIKSGMPRDFSYQELVEATNSFEKKLGEGGFGEVYKGVLRETNELVAVKRVWSGSTRGRSEYESEVKIVSQVRDMNLVQLKGWCHQTEELLIVYEFMPNGSLDSHLFNRSFQPLSWERRYKIAEGVGSALFYLHKRLNPYVLHRDVKSSNIMLDSHFEARLGDFGLARLVECDKDFRTTVPAGTPGYVDPEHWVNGEKASKANDVYSFGIVLLEIACGRRAVAGNVTLVARVREIDRDGSLLDAADPRVPMLESDKRKVFQMLTVGLRCAHHDSSQRPTIGQAIHDLKSGLSSSDSGDGYSTTPSRISV